MHAAVLHEYGTPRFDEFPDPVAGPGEVVLDVLAAGLNPADVSKADGTFYGGKPPLPSVAGSEGIGRIDGEGPRYYFDQPVAPYGSMAERTLVRADGLIEVPEGIADGVAVAFGIPGLAAWLPLTWRTRLEPGETVLVLGATGVAGQIALQAAKLLGAGRVVAAGRSAERLARARERGADAAVALGELEGEQLTAAFRDAAGGDVDVVIDLLWGKPAAAALDALGPAGRLIQIGQSAGATATLPSSSIRGRLAEILGYTNFLAPFDVRAAAFRTMVEHAGAGRIVVEVEELPLWDVEEAWAKQRAGAGRKLVLVP
jgi:NADPH2:quinone reductase